MTSSAVPLDQLLGALDRIEPFHALPEADQVRSLATAVERAALDQGQAITSDQALSAAAAQLAAVPASESMLDAPRLGWRGAWRRLTAPVPDPELHYAPSPPGSLADFPLQLEPEPDTERDLWVQRFEKRKQTGTVLMLFGLIGAFPSLLLCASWLNLNHSIPSIFAGLFLSLVGLGQINNSFWNMISKKKCGPDTIFNHAPLIARHRYALKLHAFDEAILVKASRSEEVGAWCKAHILAHLSAHHPGWSLRH